MKCVLKITSLLMVGMLFLSLSSCTPEQSTNDSASTEEHSEAPTSLEITEDYILTRPENDNAVISLIQKLKKSFKDAADKTLTIKDDWFRDPATIPEKEILVGKCDREESKKIYDELGVNEWRIAVSGAKIVIAGESIQALREAVDFFINEYVQGKEALKIEMNANHGAVSESRMMITSSMGKLRDPSILYENGVYYAYGTGWNCYKNTSGDLEGTWRSIGRVCQVPADAETDYWAPEVYKYNGAFYMFTTYKSASTGHRGCVVMRADKPEGPFVMISNGHVTPKDWDSIDGSLYIDENGKPWMVFVHEWTSTSDGIGRMAAAQMSDDLTHFISDPIELFRADDASWCRSQVTDGCWMYRCENGELIMIWSSSDESGYCVGIARSDNGRLDGNWTHDKKLLYSKSMTGEYDGGHGMIFKDKAGKLWLSIHSPNGAIGDREEIPVFIPIREENGTLVWDN